MVIEALVVVIGWWSSCSVSSGFFLAACFRCSQCSRVNSFASGWIGALRSRARGMGSLLEVKAVEYGL
jgi:hypothetical protein